MTDDVGHESAIDNINRMWYLRYLFGKSILVQPQLLRHSWRNRWKLFRGKHSTAERSRWNLFFANAEIIRGNLPPLPKRKRWLCWVVAYLDPTRLLAKCSVIEFPIVSSVIWSNLPLKRYEKNITTKSIYGATIFSTIFFSFFKERSDAKTPKSLKSRIFFSKCCKKSSNACVNEYSRCFGENANDMTLSAPVECNASLPGCEQDTRILERKERKWYPPWAS